MSGFNYLRLALAGIAAMLFLLLLVQLSRTARRGAVEALGPDHLPMPPAATVTPPDDIAPLPGGTNYTPWRLISRTVANAGSSGGPLYRLRIEPEGQLPHWHAGAIARVYCGPATDLADGVPPQGDRAADYMIGSLPKDGAVELAIRLRPARGPRPPRRSRWLCAEIEPGEQVAMAVRDQPDFATPADEVPLILVGNATGIAGLQSHLKARPPSTRNWLIFGDRRSADDETLAGMITDWVSTGHLQRCDLVLPGDGSEQRRVVDQLSDAGETLVDWALAGAAIYVCGSTPMGNDVDAVLRKLLGPEVVDAMAEHGLYRTTLY